MGHIILHKTDQAVFKLLQKLKGTFWCKAKQLQAVRLLGEVTTVMKAEKQSDLPAPTQVIAPNCSKH